MNRYFKLQEFTDSQVAARHGMQNNPAIEVRANITILVAKVLTPVREHFDLPMTITSGYRSAALNAMIKGAENSQHCIGEAADFKIWGVDNLVVAEWVRDNMVFDQLILEFYTPGVPNSGWIHVSWTERVSNRGEVLTKQSGEPYQEGLIA